jgi:predicted transcriptional regulator of viral defense system
MRREVFDHLSELAREQAGYFAAAQARRLGVHPNELVHLASTGALRRVSRGIYASSGAESAREDVIAAWLRLAKNRLPWETTPPPAVVSHTTAAALHGFGTFLPGPPTFTATGRRFQPLDGSLQLYTAQLEPDEWLWLMLPESIRLPVTTPARTIADVAFAGEQRDHVLDAIEDAREQGLATEVEIARAVHRRRRRRGRGSIAWLADRLPLP